MKPHALTLFAVFAAQMASAQSVFIYDQQFTNLGPNSGGVTLQTNQPIGQSFVPMLSSVGFVSLRIYNVSPLRGTGTNAIIAVNLWSDSISNGTLLASTSLFVAAEFRGTTNFIFPTAATVTPGDTYFLQPVVLSGGGLVLTDMSMFNTGYAYGTAFVGGQASDWSDLWFREGIVTVPEPASASLLLVVVVIGYLFSRWKKRHPRTNRLAAMNAPAKPQACYV